MAIFDYVKQFIWSVCNKIVNQIFITNKNEFIENNDTIDKLNKCCCELNDSVNQLKSKILFYF